MNLFDQIHNQSVDPDKVRERTHVTLSKDEDGSHLWGACLVYDEENEEAMVDFRGPLGSGAYMCRPELEAIRNYLNDILGDDDDLR